jgi:inorganic pyrophosphatase
MADLTALPHQLDPKTCVCTAIIETPKGCRNKFDYDPESNLFKLGGLLPEGMMFPFDFGFIPSTLGDDGDPLDIMVLMFGMPSRFIPQDPSLFKKSPKSP